MKNILKLMLTMPVLFGLMQLTGCAPMHSMPFSQASRDQITQTHVLLNGVQHHIIIHNNAAENAHMSSLYTPMPEGATVYYPASNSNDVSTDPLAQAIANIIVESVASHHNHGNNKKQLQPILHAMGQDHFMKQFKSDLMLHFATIPWLKAQSNQTIYNLDAHKNQMQLGTANNLLLVGTTYALNSHMNQLEVTAYVKSGLHTGNQVKTVYQNSFTYIYSIGHSDHTYANQHVWLRNQAALLKTQLRKAARVLSKLVAHDIAHRGMTTAPAGASQVKIYGTHDDYDGVKAAAAVLSDDHGRYTLLMPDGEIYSVNKRYLLS